MTSDNEIIISDTSQARNEELINRREALRVAQMQLRGKEFTDDDLLSSAEKIFAFLNGGK